MFKSVYILIIIHEEEVFLKHEEEGIDLSTVDFRK